MRNSPRRWAWAVLLIGAAARGQGSAPADALAEVRSKGVVEIAVYADFPPFSAGKGPQAQGIDVDLAHAIAERLQLPLKLRLINAGETISDDLRNHVWKGHYLGGGVADVMLHVGVDPKFAEQQKHNVVLFSPYFHETVSIVYKTGRIKSLQSPIALTEHKIGVEGDTIGDHILSSAYGGALRSHAVREESLEAAVTALGQGEVDAVIGPTGELHGLLTQQHITEVAYRRQEPVGQMRTAWDVGVAVKDTGEPSLSEAIGHIIAALKQDGLLKQFFANHGVEYVDASSDPASAAR